jgi:hypothetical protein
MAKRTCSTEQFQAIVKAYEAGQQSAPALAEMTGADVNVCYEVGSAIGARRTGDVQREAYQKRVALYLTRTGVDEAEALKLATAKHSV